MPRSVEVVNGVEHRYAPNPTMHGEIWAEEYPPIVSDCEWLVNKYTGEIVPNTEEFARRSDILQPYLGELPRSGVVDLNKIINDNLNHANNIAGTSSTGELDVL